MLAIFTLSGRLPPHSRATRPCHAVTVSEPVLSVMLATLPPMGGWMEQVRAAARPIAVGAATAAWVIGTVANDLSGWSFTLAAGAGAVLTALAVGIPLRAEHNARVRAGTAEQIAEDASARIQLVLNDALEPLTYLIGRITDRPRWSFGREAVELQGQAKAVVLSAAAEVLGADRLRSCFFARVDEKPVRLVPSGFHGRAEEPRTTFVEGTDLGDFALGLLARREDLFCADTEAASPPGWDPGPHKYRTFIVVPVATEARQFGILTVDGLEVGDLTEDDVTAVRVLARLLAVALGT
jgi:GAF domain-containing protein